MEPNPKEQPPLSPAASAGSICPTCHQPTLPQYYFCPNCGAKLTAAPLPTSAAAQARIYALSIVLPMLCFLFVSKWRGAAYFRSNDPAAKKIGIAAWTLLILSTVITVWLAVVWTENAVQSSVNSVNADLGGF